MRDTIPFDGDFDPAPETLVTLSPLVRRIVAPNPGPMTFKGTNTYVVGHGAVAVIDPGPDEPAHVEAILDALGSDRVAAIVVTHTHRDHSPASRLLKARTGAPIIGCGPHVAFRPAQGAEAASVATANDLEHAPDRILADGECYRGDGFSLVAVGTPGHTMNHLCFALPEERTLFSGDHVMAWSTTIVSPPSGSMAAYLASLETLRGRDETLYWPGHGGPVREPARFVRALIHHRRQREASILNRLAAGDRSVTGIVDATYENLDPRLKRAAALSVLAHLEDLEASGRVRRSGDARIDAEWSIAP
jgi:glyoxylase-like metal-dependent hydrolase (beta-lactamase superfamily II)